MTVGSGLLSTSKPGIPHLNDGELADLRKDLATLLAPMAAIAVEEFTNLVSPVAPGAAVLKAATATTVAPQTILAAAMLAAGLAQLAACPRPLSFTTAGGTAADAPATVLITGTDPFGAAQTETVTLAQTATIATGLKAFKTVTKVDYAAADGTGATIAIGIGAAFLKNSTASVAAAVTVAGSTLNQAHLALVPRQLVFTTAGVTPADVPANVVITGKDINGRAQSETLVLAQTATTATSVKFYARIDSLAYPVGQGTAGLITVSFGVPVGLARKLKTRAGLAGLIREIANGAVVTNGTIVDAATATPNGSWSPNSAPNDALDYAIYYEYDATVAA